MTASARKRILIVGGGFGGIYTAMRLQKAAKRRTDIEIALVDQKNYFVFQPLLPEVISGSIGIMHTVTPLRDLCPGIRLYVRNIEQIDLEQRVVVTSHGLQSQSQPIPFDHLVLALGMEENFSVVRGLPEHGLHFKNLGDALALRNRLILLLDAADTEPDTALRRQMLTFVMAGGGFSGVEVIAEVNDFVRAIARRYPRLDPAELRVILLHSGTRILPELPESLSLYAQRLLDRRQVEIRLGTRLEAVTADEAILNDGTRISTNTVLATIGTAPNAMLSLLPCAKERGRVVVDANLAVPDVPGLWALGDCAYIIDHKTGQACPPTAQYAVSEGKCLAANILAQLDGKPLRPFSFSALGMMGSLGHQSAVGNVLGVKVSGLVAWFMWRTVYWMKLPGLRRKVYVAIDWFLNLFMPKDLVQLNVAPSESIIREHFEAGEVVFRQGDHGDRVYIIINGEAEVIREDNDGKEHLIARLRAKDCFGEMALIRDSVRTATVRTSTHLDALSLQRRTFTDLFTHIPVLRDSLEQMVEDRERDLGETES